MNMASVWSLPIIYVCENNLYAMSTPVNVAYKIRDITVRSVAYGMPGYAVDGMDVIAVRQAVAEAVETARRGKGPTLIECKTYRFSGHSKSDPRNYRTRQEEALWETRDPIKLLSEKLKNQGVSEAELMQIENKVKEEINEAITYARDRANVPVPR